MKKLLFDVDGTILDSMHIWAESQNKILKKYGLSINTLPLKIKAEIESLPYKKMCKYLADNIALDMTYEEVLSYFSNIIDQAYREELMPFVGALDLLEKLHSKEFSMSVASSTPYYLIEFAFKRLGIFDYFDFYATPDKLGLKKSEAKYWKHIIKKYGVKAENCILIDDALYAIKSAKDQGINTIGVKDYPWNRKEWSKIKKEADYVVSNISQIDIKNLN